MALINPLMTFSRASSAWLLSGGSLQSFGNDVPRFDSSGNLVMEGQRTNVIRNPRAEGSAAGTPGTLPSNWFGSTTANGISRQIVGTGTESGIPYIDIRYSGTASGTATPFLIFDTTGGSIFPTAAVSQVWSFSVFVRLISGSLTGVNTLSIGIEERSGATYLGGSVTNIVPTFAALSTQLYAHTRTLSFGSTNGAAQAFYGDISNGVTVDFTLRFGTPQAGQASFPSNRILPAVGSPAASTRLADILSTPLSTFSIPSGGLTVVGRVMIPQSAPTGNDQVLFQVDDGTNTNRYLLLNVAGGNNIQTRIGATTGGALFIMTPGTEFTYAASVNISAGTISVSINGGTAVTQSGGPTSGLTTLRLTSNATPASNLFGLLKRHILFPAPQDAADLPFLTSLV